MIDFSDLVQVYFASLGVSEIKTRSGTHAVGDCDLDNIVPFVAWNVLIRSKVLLGRECLAGKFYADSRLLNVTCPKGVEVIDTHGCLKTMAWLFEDFENGDLSLIDDLVTQVLLEFDGELPVNVVANHVLLEAYGDLILNWAKERAPTVEVSNENEVVHGA